ncbi:MAG: magnesium transporter [Methanophagales archaeon]|nr:magnesium transporter [Methanophagales archaeon]MCW3140088.1 magnesium transporter [Methanophagales archaeon]MCW7070143.1 magnesium transporter [Methanophagales archaeon]MCW7073804.1 magnesium transporter [Methanophagales archaeon]
MRMRDVDIDVNVSKLSIRILNRTSAFFRDFSDVFKQAPLSLVFCTLTGLLAGLGLNFMRGILQLLPELMILIPPAIDMRGNIYSALVSRLGTSMHIGLFSKSIRRGSVLYQNAYSSLLLTLALSVILGILARLVAFAFGMSQISIFGFVFISVIGGLISGFVLLGIAILVSIIGYHKNWDLDNVSSPIITSAGDVVTIPSLMLATMLLLKLDSVSVYLNTSSLLFMVLAVVGTIKGLKSNDTVVRRIIKESIPMLIICGILGIFAGLILDRRLESIIAIPAILVMIPPFLGASNALGGILSARLSSMLHIGTLNPKLYPPKSVVMNFTVIYLLSVFIFALVGIISGVIGGKSGVLVLRLLSISLLGGILCSTFLNFASYYIAILSFKFGLDPDNHTIPLITSLTDVVGVLCLIFAIFLIL